MFSCWVVLVRAGVLICFDLSRKDTFEKLDKWIEQVSRYGPVGCTRLFVGLKSDLESTVTDEEAEVCFHTFIWTFFGAKISRIHVAHCRNFYVFSPPRRLPRSMKENTCSVLPRRPKM
jgi:GTPase SAR1 family protein